MAAPATGLDGLNNNNTSQFFALLSAHKANLVAARARTGEIPCDHVPREVQLREYLEQYEAIQAEKEEERKKRKDTGGTATTLTNAVKKSQRMQSTIIGEPYHPSTAPLSLLKKITIRELALETHHRGRFMVLRMAVPPARMNAVISLAEDEIGDVVTFSLYMQEPEQVRPAEEVLPRGTVVVLKEPYFKVTGGGGYGIRVDHPTDLLWLDEKGDDERVPRCWRVVDPTKGRKSAEELKKEGNELVCAGKYWKAVERYTTALEASPAHLEAEVIHNNRALSYLKLGKYDSALEDVNFEPDLNARSEKALYRGALALYGLRRFDEAQQLLDILVAKFPDSVTGQRELARVKSRLQEQNHGKYDFKKMYQQAKMRPPLIDCASFVGAVEVRNVKGKGRGLFTSRNVKCGELLACEKAFVYGCAEPPEKDSSPDTAEFGVLINLTTDRVKLGTEAGHISNVYQKLINNPSLAPAFLDLCHDGYEPASSTKVDGMPVIDSFLIERIVSLNTFGCPITSKDQELTRAQSGEISSSSGIWPLAAYINHSCNANSARTFIGDMMIMRAAQDLSAGTELTWCYHDPTDRTNLQKSLQGHWGFQCSCPVCLDEASTGDTVKKQRNKLLALIQRTHMADKRRSQSIDALYSIPTTVVPRYHVFRCYYEAAMYWFRPKYNPQMVVMFAARALEALGFEMDELLEDDSDLLAERRWGVPVPEVVRLWELLTIFAPYAKGYSKLLVSARENWRSAYEIIVAGENETFGEAAGQVSSSSPEALMKKLGISSETVEFGNGDR